jgi:hypothetical protein
MEIHYIHKKITMLIHITIQFKMSFNIILAYRQVRCRIPSITSTEVERHLYYDIRVDTISLEL